MVFGTGAGHVFEAWQLHFAARFRGWKAATFGFVQIFNGQLHTSKGVAKLQTMTAGAGVPNHLERMIRLMNSHSTHRTKFRNRTSNNIDRSLSSFLWGRRHGAVFNSAPHECADYESQSDYSPMVKRAPSRRPSDHPEKHQKSFAFGKAFWTESGSLMSVSKSIIPALPILRLPKIKKMPF